MSVISDQGIHRAGDLNTLQSPSTNASPPPSIILPFYFSLLLNLQRNFLFRSPLTSTAMDSQSLSIYSNPSAPPPSNSGLLPSRLRNSDEERVLDISEREIIETESERNREKFARFFCKIKKKSRMKEAVFFD
ncbi:unnamed protein product [Vicia faba]|uniref:Uncharacterized protein n=1 Tax=Vicia faba TaxID=3906 RepID=A0AAV1AY79_VICFA|nr:unnamed protein product [Vicia faba]